MGLCYAKGLRKPAAESLLASRVLDCPFRSAEDRALRVPSLNRGELLLLTQIGALNKLSAIEHRRDALWQVSRAGKLEGPLLRQSSELLEEDSRTLPLTQMSTWERLVADYAGTRLTMANIPCSTGDLN
jgi:error-prone DNA polymerase